MITANAEDDDEHRVSIETKERTPLQSQSQLNTRQKLEQLSQKRNTVKPAQVITSIKQSPVLKWSPFPFPVMENVLSTAPL